MTGVLILDFPATAINLHQLLAHQLGDIDISIMARDFQLWTVSMPMCLTWPYTITMIVTQPESQTSKRYSSSFIGYLTFVSR